MEEKKLIDDEIVNAYIHCVLKRGDCDNCPYDEVGCGVDGNDLIKIINRQKAEIERLTEELETKKKECREIADDYQEMGTFYYNETVKSAELQKQVDKLKEQRDVFKRLFESVNTTHFSTDILIETMNSFYREQADHLAGLKIEQAVKDIAPLAIQRFINQLDIDEIIRVDSDLGKELLKEKEFVLKRYHGMEME